MCLHRLKKTPKLVYTWLKFKDLALLYFHIKPLLLQGNTRMFWYYTIEFQQKKGKIFQKIGHYVYMQNLM